MESKVLNSLIRTNIKNMLLVVMYGYKLASVDDKFSSKPFTLYLGKDAVYNFINNMIDCRHVVSLLHYT